MNKAIKQHIIELFLLSFFILQIFMITVAADSTYINGYFIYTVNDESVSIVSYVGKDETVTVPAMIAGNPVNVIKSGAFSESPAKTIYLPDTIMKVEVGAFSQNQKTVFESIAGGNTKEPDVTNELTSDVVSEKADEATDPTSETEFDQSGQVDTDTAKDPIVSINTGSQDDPSEHNETTETSQSLDTRGSHGDEEYDIDDTTEVEDTAENTSGLTIESVSVTTSFDDSTAEKSPEDSISAEINNTREKTVFQIIWIVISVCVVIDVGLIAFAVSRIKKKK